MKNNTPLKTLSASEFNSCEGGDILFSELCKFGTDSLTPPKKLSAISDEDIEGGIMFWSRSNRHSHPDGSKDNAGRWYPSDGEDPQGTISRNYRSPSRAWPWSYMTACRTAQHCAELAGADVSNVRKVKNFIEKTLATWAASAKREDRRETAGVPQALQSKDESTGIELEIALA